MTEVQIIQELLYCFQGIEGNILRSDGDNGFKLDPLVTCKMLTLHDVEQCFPTFFYNARQSCYRSKTKAAV